MVIDFDTFQQDFSSLRKTLGEVNEKLESLEDAVYILLNTLKRYDELIDISTLVPKENLIKFRLSRIIKRMSFDKTKSVLGARINFKFYGFNKDLSDVIINYIDTNIRPSDILFIFEDGSVGIIYIINKDEESKIKVIRRIEEILSNFELQFDCRGKASIEWELVTTELKPDDTVEGFLKRLKEGNN